MAAWWATRNGSVVGDTIIQRNGDGRAVGDNAIPNK